MTIQVGRTYLDGENTKCRIVEYDASHPAPFLDDNGSRYLEDGSYYSGRGAFYPELNLVREVVDPEELREEIAELRREVAELRELILHPNP